MNKLQNILQWALAIIMLICSIIGLLFGIIKLTPIVIIFWIIVLLGSLLIIKLLKDEQDYY